MEKLEEIPIYLHDTLNAHGLSPKSIQFAVMSDLSHEGDYNCEIWAGVSGGLFFVLEGSKQLVDIKHIKNSTFGKKTTHKLYKWQDKVYTTYQISDIEEIKTENLTSSGMLTITVSGKDICVCRINNAKVQKFNLFSRLVTMVKEGKEITEKDLSLEMFNAYCPKCGRRYPEVERKVCPFCMDKKKLLFRVFTLFPRYKKEVAIIIICILLSNMFSLVLPMLNGRILIDDVLTMSVALVDEGGNVLKDANGNDIIKKVDTKYDNGDYKTKDGYLIKADGSMVDKEGNFMLQGYRAEERKGQFYGKIIEIVLLIAFLRLITVFINIIYGRINSGVTAKIVYDLKCDIFSAMQKLSLSFFTSKQTGGLMHNINWDANHLQNFFHDGVPYFITNCISLVAVTIILLNMNWVLTLIILIPVPFIIIFIKGFLPKIWKLYSRSYRRNRSMNNLLNDNITGIRVVKAFGKENEEISRFGKVNTGIFSIQQQLGHTTQTVFPILYFFLSIGSFLAWGIGGIYVSGGEMTFGQVYTYLQYIWMIYGPLEFMIRISDWFSDTMNSAQRIFEVLDAVPEIAEIEEPVRLDHMKGDISLSNVMFEYEINKPVIKDINLDIKAGEMIGLCGHSGAGKSTIINLISRLYDVKEGSIKIDGVDIRYTTLRDLRDQISIVLQETFLFIGTIAQNIAYSRPDSTIEEIVAAAKAANAHDFILKMPEGYDTRVGSGGHGLSGGEKQRIAIARSIIHNPKILILDEATSSVDTETEGKIQEALEILIKGRTTISIAHRLSTLRNADRLVVMEKGKMIEIGTHDELYNKKGAYYNLVETQREALKIRGLPD